ncbi:putative clathrin assembly protein At1g25240 [Arachis duranensis]|uniref:Clathrin assembly protein At1g25240 n=1 Tax=Arachis duranensis TaxID=130453 RepID=A0A6P4BRF1_ARADU|nr:putative clathrin assembly protein At1g25240 [Arachis duranensis]
MAAAMVGGALLSTYVQVLLDKIISNEFLDFFRRRKLNVTLLGKMQMNLKTKEEDAPQCLTFLQGFYILECPEFESFPHLGLPTPKLRRFWVSYCNMLNSLLEPVNALVGLQELTVLNLPITKNIIKMRIWKRAAGALKDNYSILVAKFSPHGHPDLERVVIKATSHNEQCMDYKSIQRVFQWLRSSPLYLKPLLYTLSTRMEKTHSWVVAIKGLMLIHGVFCFDLPTVQMLRRLPFDMTHFSDGHLNPEKAWGYNAFIRAYYSYLDLKSSYVCAQAARKRKPGKKTEETLAEELQNLEKLQGLIDAILHVKPRNPSMHVVLVLEAMDCVIDEVLEVYDSYCKGMERVILKIFDMGGTVEAGTALRIIEKGEMQGDKLALYFEFCREIGVLNVSDSPKILRVAEKDVKELKGIIDGVNEKKKKDKNMDEEDEDDDVVKKMNEEMAIVVRENDFLMKKTVITDQWEVFDDDVAFDQMSSAVVVAAAATNNYNPFLELDSSYNSIVPYNPHQHHVLPDLISF